MKAYISEDGKTHIGLVLAGAVTAGAFTAGVMDYFLNTLELWNKKHQENRDQIPEPNVVIDNITGASAGSIAAAVTLISLATRRFKSKDNPSDVAEDDNLHYYTWVKYGLDSKESLIDKLFSPDDIKDNDVKSILNTHFIDGLIEKITEIVQKSEIQQLPCYINQNMEVLITLSNLRGIPLDISFSNEKSKAAHSMSYHKAFAHFKYLKDSSDPSMLPLDFHDAEQLKLFLDCSRASGAFPIGLRSVPFRHIPKAYITENLKQIFGKDTVLNPQIDEFYEFLAVDGGMTNNEPIAEAMRILRKRTENKKVYENFKKMVAQTQRDDVQLYDMLPRDMEQNLEIRNPIILIDPFPNYLATNKKKQAYDIGKDNVVEIIPQLYKTLRNQVLFKEKDIADLFNEDTNKSMIWPTRYDEDDVPLYNPIATGALSGFSGFFDEKFRHHDYMLGKKNCQNFIRYYFTQDESESRLTPEQKEQFGFRDKNGNKRVPIIPDYRINGLDSEDERKPFLPKVEQQPGFPKYPQVDQDQLINNTLKPILKRRIKKIVKALMSSTTQNNGTQLAHPFKAKKPLGRQVLGFITPKFIINPILKGTVSRRLTNFILDYITFTMHHHDLFKNNPNPPDTRMGGE